MFKSWQIFVFSLVPLALVFVGVIGGSIHGSDSAPQEYPTPPPAPPPAASGTSTPGGGANILNITAQNLLFNPRTLTAPANTSVTVRMANQDQGVLHNVSVYTNNQATTKIFVGDLVTGVANKDYTFTTPAAGTYFFRCDVHPDTMTGTFNVR